MDKVKYQYYKLTTKEKQDLLDLLNSGSEIVIETMIITNKDRQSIFINPTSLTADNRIKAPRLEFEVKDKNLIFKG